jgi:hypothetical protein
MKRLKVLDIPWNLDEQYEMLPLPFIAWSWLIQYRISYKDLRPEFEHYFQWVLNVEDHCFDAALLHVDLDEPSSKYQSKRRVYEELNTLITGVPKVVVVHASHNDKHRDATLIRNVRDRIGDNHAVVSSQFIANQLDTGHVIFPGIDISKYRDLPKEPRVVTSFDGPGGEENADIETLKRALRARDIQLCTIGTDFIPNTWSEYRDFIGRSLIYLTTPSSSEWAQLEASLSGSCIVHLLPHHSVSDDTPESDWVITHHANALDVIEELIRNPAKAIRIGQSGKTRTQFRYNWDRYAEEWQSYLNEIMKER